MIAKIVRKMLRRKKHSKIVAFAFDPQQLFVVANLPLLPNDAVYTLTAHARSYFPRQTEITLLAELPRFAFVSRTMGEPCAWHLIVQIRIRIPGGEPK